MVLGRLVARMAGGPIAFGVGRARTARRRRAEPHYDVDGTATDVDDRPQLP